MKPASSSYQFDLIDAASFGYGAVWTERAYLLRMAIVPILLKFASMVVIIAQGYDQNPLTQGLALIPATLVEGWLLAQWLRTLIKNERWPIILYEEPNESTLSYLMTRARGIVSCCLVYVLIMLATFFLKFGYEQLINTYLPKEALEAGTPQDIRTLPFVLIAMIAGLWSFRLFWIYIPFSALVGPMDYLKYMGGFSASLRLLGLFLIGMVPTLVMATLISSVVVSPFAAGGEDAKKIGQFLILLLGSMAEILIALIVTASIAWSMRSLLPRESGCLPDVKQQNRDDDF